VAERGWLAQIINELAFQAAGGALKKLNIGFIILILILCYHIITKNIIRMSVQETANPITSNKKLVRKEIGEKLAGALAEYKQELGEKKLETRVKEVSKLISRDLLKISKKQKRNEKKASLRAAGKGSKPAAKK
jgi:hypothetical protein